MEWQCSYFVCDSQTSDYYRSPRLFFRFFARDTRINSHCSLRERLLISPAANVARRRGKTFRRMVLPKSKPPKAGSRQSRACEAIDGDHATAERSLVRARAVGAKIKSRHFCRNSECRLFCRPKMCYNVFKKEVLFKEVEI